MRTRALLATAGLATAGFIVAGVSAGQGIASAGTDHTLTVHEKLIGTYTQDLGKKGMTLGDQLAFATVLRDLKGTKIGIGAGNCVLFSGRTESDAQYHCTESYRLGSDQLIGAGMFSSARKINKWAIMGGTGRYRGASGQVDFTAPTADSFINTFRFDS